MTDGRRPPIDKYLTTSSAQLFAHDDYRYTHERLAVLPLRGIATFLLRSANKIVISVLRVLIIP